MPRTASLPALAGQQRARVLRRARLYCRRLLTGERAGYFAQCLFHHIGYVQAGVCGKAAIAGILVHVIDNKSA